MKICVIGAGAVGGMIAAPLARAGHEVSLVARGAHLAALRAHGLTLGHAGGEYNLRCPASDDPASFGPQDAVFLSLKAYSIAKMLPRLAPLIGVDTVVVPAINGLPWWYFFREGGRFDGTPIRCLDPDGAMLKALDPARILGCVVHAAGEVARPGFVRQTSAECGLVLGEPDDKNSSRLTRIVKALAAAGLKASATERIREAVWIKLQGNIAFNPVSALTLATQVQVLADPRLVDLVRALMTETAALAAAYGVRIAMTVEQRIEVARRAGVLKPSMLQDVEQGRPVEVDAIVGAAAELAARAGVPVSTIAAIHALLAARDAGLRAPG